MSLGNTPSRQTNISLEADKSFALTLRFLTSDGLVDKPYDLTGAEVRLVAVEPQRFGGEVVISLVATLLDPLNGVAQFPFEAATLSLEPGEYPYDVTLLPVNEYSMPIIKGLLVIGTNTDTANDNVFGQVDTGSEVVVLFGNVCDLEIRFEGVDVIVGPVGEQGEKGDPTGVFVQPDPPGPTDTPPYFPLWVDTDAEYKHTGYVYEGPEPPPDMGTGVLFFDNDETNIPPPGVGVLYVKAQSGELVPVSRSIPGPPGADGADGAGGPPGPGAPTGGTTNQVLAKNSGADFDTKWADPALDGMTLAQADARYVNVPGDTMTGPLAMEGGGGHSSIGNDVFGDLEVKSTDKAVTIKSSSSVSGDAVLLEAVQGGVNIQGESQVRIESGSGEVLLYSDVTMGGTARISDMAAPVDPQDATNKQYVDARAVPAGGTTDQVLAKTSATDHDLKWATPTAGGGGGGTVIHSGVIPPEDWRGAIGDYYLDKTTKILYGPKVAVTGGYGPPQSTYTSQLPANMDWTQSTFTYEYGKDIVFRVAGRVTGLRFYRNSSSGSTSRQLKMYNYSNSALLGTINTVNDVGSGWISGYFASPISVTALQTVRITISVYGHITPMSTAAAPDIVNGDLTMKWQAWYNNAGSMPTVTSTIFPFTDVIFEAGSPPLTTPWPIAVKGIPPGGGAAEVLAKSSATDFDTKWAVAGSPTEKVAISSATASSTYQTNTPDRAYDGSTTTQWYSSAVPPQWIRFDLGSAKPVSAVRMFHTSTDFPTTLLVESSTDDSVWTVRHTRNSAPPAGWLTIDLGSVTTARYWRVRGTAGGSWWQLFEVEFYQPVLIGGHVVLDEGLPITARPYLNFAGAGVTATDDATNGRTLVTIPGSTGGLDQTTADARYLQLTGGTLSGTLTSSVPSTNGSKALILPDGRSLGYIGSSAALLLDGGAKQIQMKTTDNSGGAWYVDARSGTASISGYEILLESWGPSPISLLGTIDATGHRILRVVDPVADTDAANKQYVDTAAVANRTLLKQAVWRVDASKQDGAGLLDLTGRGRKAVFGTGAARPTVLPWTGENYLYFNTINPGTEVLTASANATIPWVATIEADFIDTSTITTNELFTQGFSSGLVGVYVNLGTDLIVRWRNGAAWDTLTWAGVFTPGVRYRVSIALTQTGATPTINGVAQATKSFAVARSAPVAGGLQFYPDGSAAGAFHLYGLNINNTHIFKPGNVPADYKTFTNTGTAGGTWTLTRAPTGYKATLVDRPLVLFGGAQNAKVDSPVMADGTVLIALRDFPDTVRSYSVMFVDDTIAKGGATIFRANGSTTTNFYALGLGGTEDALSSSALSDGQRVMGISLNRSAMKTYVNGALAATDASIGTAALAGGRYAIGGHLGNQGFFEFLSMAVWDRVLTDAEIAQATKELLIPDLPTAAEMDTGWRNITSLLINGWTALPSDCKIRRIGNTVELTIGVQKATPTSGGAPGVALTWLPGFMSPSNVLVPVWNDATAQFIPTLSGITGASYGSLAAFYGATATPANNLLAFTAVYITNDPWPTVLPGTPL